VRADSAYRGSRPSRRFPGISCRRQGRTRTCDTRIMIAGRGSGRVRSRRVSPDGTKSRRPAVRAASRPLRQGPVTTPLPPRAALRASFPRSPVRRRSVTYGARLSHSTSEPPSPGRGRCGSAGRPARLQASVEPAASALAPGPLPRRELRTGRWNRGQPWLRSPAPTGRHRDERATGSPSRRWRARMLDS